MGESYNRERGLLTINEELEKMANVFDVAKYILKNKGPISTWKLQKLCYYSQAWSLAWTEKALFDQDFEAWKNGPVCPLLFNAHQGRYKISYDDLKFGNPDDLTDDQKDTIKRVVDEYGNMEPYELREMTHNEDPWKSARGNCPENAYCHNVISKESMGQYYGSL